MTAIVYYKYVSPNPAGPFKGKDKWDGKHRYNSDPLPSKGDEVYMPFGLAVVTSIRKG